MVEPLRHRQTKGAETDMPDLPPPRHFPTLPTEILSIFKNHPSDVVRRFAALALHATGSQADAMALRTEYANSSPLTRLAILLASRKLGHDERQHWRQTLQLTGILERKL